MPDDAVGFDYAAIIARKQQEMAEQAEQERIAKLTLDQQVGRDVRSAGTGLNDAIGGAIGAVPDLINAGLRTVGIPSSRPGFYSDAAKSALNSVGDYLSGGRIKPTTTPEKIAYGVGQGAGDAVATVVPAAGVARLAQAAPVVSGVARSLASNPVMQTVAGAVGGGVKEGTGSTGAGLAASLAVPFGAGALRGVISPGLSQLNAEQQRLAQTLLGRGISLTPGQQSGSKMMQVMESTLDRLPLTSGPQNAVRTEQRQQFNKAVLGEMGVTGETLATPEVINQSLDNTWNRISGVYGRNNFTVDAPAMQGVQQLADEMRWLYGSDVQKALGGHITELLNKIRPGPQGGYIVEGEAFQKLDSALSKRIRETSDGDLRSRLTDLRTTLRDSMDNSILHGGTPEDAATLAEARRHYAVGKEIQKVINTPTLDAIAGDISPAQLARVVASGSGQHFATGRDALRDLAAGGKMFIKDNIPNSGTNERSMMTHLLTGGMFGSGGWSMAGGNPFTGALMGAGGVALPRLVQMAYQSRLGDRFARNQALSGMPNPINRGAFTGIATAPQVGLLEDQLPQQ